MTEKRDLARELAQAYSKQIPQSFERQRAEAWDALQSLGLPGNKTEEYRFTPVTRQLEKTFASWPSLRLAAGEVNISEHLIPGLDAYVVALINGVYSPSLSNADSAPFTVTRMSEGAVGNGFREVLFSGIDFKKDPFAALNTAIWTDGVMIHVPNGTNVGKPLLLLHLSDGSKEPLSAHDRIAIIVEEDAQLTLVEKFVATGPAVFSTLMEELLVKEGARLDYIKLQGDMDGLSINHTSIRQLDRSLVNTFTLTMKGKLIRNNLAIAIDGEGCESHFHGLYLLTDDTLADNHTVVDHRKPNSYSNELYKGVMDGSSKGVFNGKIYVRPNAQKTNAFQSNRNILLSDKATINTKPQLEIWADDVKCSHGCTTGQLDEEALFYLQSRGIRHDAALGMLLYAFAAETFQIISNERLRSHVDDLISKRLNKVF